MTVTYKLRMKSVLLEALELELSIKLSTRLIESAQLDVITYCDFHILSLFLVTKGQYSPERGK